MKVRHERPDLPASIWRWLRAQSILGSEIPDINDIKRRIFVAERRSDTSRPDHFYKNYRDARIGAFSMLHELPLVVLSALADRFLIRSGSAIHVRNEAFEDWQQLLPSISPLAVVVAFLVNEGVTGDLVVIRAVIWQTLLAIRHSYPRFSPSCSCCSKQTALMNAYASKRFDRARYSLANAVRSPTTITESLRKP